MPWQSRKPMGSPLGGRREGTFCGPPGADLGLVWWWLEGPGAGFGSNAREASGFFRRHMQRHRHRGPIARSRSQFKARDWRSRVRLDTFRPRALPGAPRARLTSARRPGARSRRRKTAEARFPPADSHEKPGRVARCRGSRARAARSRANRASARAEGDGINCRADGRVSVWRVPAAGAFGVESAFDVGVPSPVHAGEGAGGESPGRLSSVRVGRCTNQERWRLLRANRATAQGNAMESTVAQPRAAARGRGLGTGALPRGASWCRERV